MKKITLTLIILFCLVGNSYAAGTSGSNTKSNYDQAVKLIKDAKKYDRLTYDDVIEKKLTVMDLTAICLSRDHGVPIKVFDMKRSGALLDNVLGLADGTLIN